ncbi:MAG: hypothetical protein M3Q48_02755 [Actinomycetota bacterium]|nr:hypothetical protein [Actinomycetota bacterium]
MTSEDRRRRRALERQDKGYPGALGRSVPTVSDEEWVSQFDAARQLEVSMARVGFLIQVEASSQYMTPVAEQGCGATQWSAKRGAEWVPVR